MRAARWTLAVALAAALSSRALGEEPATSRYAPLPPSIETIVGSPADEALATAALAAAENARPLEVAPACREARALLVLLDGVGLKHAAACLARGGCPPLLLRHLLAVVAASPEPDVDVLLERAAEEDDPDLRALAAEGLGRGRSARAVPALARLATDPSAAVRASALRALFALEGTDAVAARAALPADARADLRAERLRLHRLRGDRGPAVLGVALDAWRRDRVAEVRTQAARMLCALGEETPAEVLALVLRESGAAPLESLLVRAAHGFPATGYDPVETRRVAVEATAALLVGARADAAIVDRAVGWVARPIDMEARDGTERPEDVLRKRLPDLGAAIVEPVLARLRSNGFDDPSDGTTLLRALGREIGLPPLRALLGDDVPPSVRTAAAGAISELGVGDAALARRLLDPKERRSFRHDVAVALGADPEPWATALLGAELERAGADLVEEAALALERRLDEPQARRLLVDEVFRRPGNAPRRLKPLLAAADDEAFALLARALADRRFAIRKAGLGALVDVPQLRGPRAREMLLAYRVVETEPGPRAHETEGVLYGLVAVAPDEAVPFARARWDELAVLRYQDQVIQKLGDARGAAVDRAVVDFVLEKTPADATAQRLRFAVSTLSNRRGHRDGEIDDVFRRGLLHADRSVADGTVDAMEAPGRGDLTEPLLALLRARAGGDVDSDSAHDVFSALRFQPFTARVEERALAVALDATEPTDARIAASELLAGRMGEATRRRLLGWLADTAFGRGDPDVERALAAAAGDGGGPVVAATFARMIEAEILSRYATLGSLDPDADASDDRSERVDALARGLARTGDGAAMERLVALVLDPRFATYAQSAVRIQARRLGRAGATDAARPPPSLDALRLATPEAPYPLPLEIYALAVAMKSMEDDALARSLAAALRAARATGGLARFPDVYFERILGVLEDPRTGHRPRATDVLSDVVRDLEPVDGAADLAAASGLAARRAAERRIVEAVAAQAEVVRILARRGHDATDERRWLRERATLDGLRGAEAASQRRDAEAEEAFSRALLRAPLDPGILGGIARQRVLVGAGLAKAEAAARRAIVLQRRLAGQEEPDALDALAAVRIAQGAADDAVDLMAVPALDAEAPTAHHLRYAEALVLAGRAHEAVKPVAQAIHNEPGLHAHVLALPWMAPLRDHPDIVRAATAAADRLRRLTTD